MIYRVILDHAIMGPGYIVTLKTESCHNANFVITDDDNL